MGLNFCASHNSKLSKLNVCVQGIFYDPSLVGCVLGSKVFAKVSKIIPGLFIDFPGCDLTAVGKLLYLALDFFQGPYFHHRVLRDGFQVDHVTTKKINLD